jgi:hypothetical protein
MDDLIGLIAFVVIAAINLLAQAAKKKKQQQQMEGAEPQPEREPTPFESFFEDLADKLEPKPTPLPDWPKGYQRPDYVQEMEAFEPVEEVEVTPIVETPPQPETIIEPVTEELDQVAAFNAPIPITSSVFSGSGLMRLPSVPLMKSNAPGKIDVDLTDRKKLKQAIIANMIFSQPRAYDCSFDNTIAK